MAASRPVAATIAAFAAAEAKRIAEEEANGGGLAAARAKGVATIEKMLGLLRVLTRFKAKDEPLPTAVDNLVNVGRL